MTCLHDWKHFDGIGVLICISCGAFMIMQTGEIISRELKAWPLDKIDVQP